MTSSSWHSSFSPGHPFPIPFLRRLFALLLPLLLALLLALLLVLLLLLFPSPLCPSRLLPARVLSFKTSFPPPNPSLERERVRVWLRSTRRERREAGVVKVEEKVWAEGGVEAEVGEESGIELERDRVGIEGVTIECVEVVDG